MSATHRQAMPGRQTSESFRPDIQGLRAISIALVMAYHLFPHQITGGYVGVDAFFVISGFLITGHLAATFRATGRVQILRFYGRRARRLLPAAVVVLTATWIAAKIILPVSELEATADQIRASAFYFQNWLLAGNATDYMKSSQATSPVQHFWSLSVEEQFYLVWPFLLVLAAGVASALFARARRRGAELSVAAARERAIQVAAGLGVVVVAASLWYSAHLTATDQSQAYFVTTTRIWELGVGGLLALAAPQLRRLRRLGPLAWLGLGLVLTSAFTLSDASAFPGTIALVPVCGAALLIVSGSRAARFGPAVLTTLRPLVFLGDISYSAYLWHWPLIVLWQAYYGPGIGSLDGPVIVVVTIVLSWLTKLAVEDPIRRARTISVRTSRSLAVAVVPLIPVLLTTLYLHGLPKPGSSRPDAAHPGATALAMYWAKTHGASSTPPPDTLPKDLRPSLATAHDDVEVASGPPCQAPEQSTKVSTCTFGDKDNPTRTIALVGDSLAAEWSTDLDQLGKKHGWKLVTMTHASCQWTSVMTVPPSKGTPFIACHTWGKAALTALLALKPDVVVFSDHPDRGIMSDKKSDPHSRTVIGRGMAPYLEKLIDNGAQVVGIEESPRPYIDIPDCLAGRNGSIAKCTVAHSKAVYTHTPVEAAIAKLKSDPDYADSARRINLNPLICGPTQCRPIVGDVIVYRDADHLTNTYSLTLKPYLEKALLKVKPLAD